MLKPRFFLVSAAIVVAHAAAGCASAGTFVWADDLPESPKRGDYVVDSGDVLSVRVWNQEGMSTRGRVRTDGKLFIPFVGDVMAKGRRPVDLATLIETKIKDFIVAPKVTITLEETPVRLVSVVGEVTRPGVYPIDATGGVLQALAGAGGPTDNADRDRIFVLRNGATANRIRFTYKALIRGVGRGATFSLEPGDVVVVE